MKRKNLILVFILVVEIMLLTDCDQKLGSTEFHIYLDNMTIGINLSNED